MPSEIVKVAAKARDQGRSRKKGGGAEATSPPLMQGAAREVETAGTMQTPRGILGSEGVTSRGSLHGHDVKLPAATLSQSARSDLIYKLETNTVKR